MNKEEAKETKGLLLIDGAYNTLLIPMNSYDMRELIVNFIQGNTKYVRKNKTKSDLNRSIREYLAKEYINKERDDS